MSWKFWKNDDGDSNSGDSANTNPAQDSTASKNDDAKTVVAEPVKKEEPKKEKKGLGAKMKEAAMKKMMEKQLKQLPPEQREIVMKAVSSNPEFFEKIAKEIEAETRKGTSQMAASMKVMRKYQGELQKIMMGSR